ncbi:MAG: DNA/RNA non-specific endonuclease [Clostridia bacterium]|nr:DNA/RNA non-specific endonuclease [Clostridia bacterium]
MMSWCHRFAASALAVLLLFCASSCTLTASDPSSDAPVYSLSELPAYNGEPSVVLNSNVPLFRESEMSAIGFEEYSSLDRLGRCGVVLSCIGPEMMPTEERGPIGSVKPSGWKTAKYDFVDGKYLYNRCHLIGFQLTGENANERNLITGTRYMNTEGMLPYENLVANYIRTTGNHVMYRVTPDFRGEELVARGVAIEALSVEDDGEGLCFYVYCYNVQPGVTILYEDGANYESLDTLGGESERFVLNTNSKKIHRPDCASVKAMSDMNRQDFEGSLAVLEAQGYRTCGECF